MPYITLNAPVRYHQTTIEELLDAPPGAMPVCPVGKLGDTKTIFVEEIPERVVGLFSMGDAIRSMRLFCEKNEKLILADKQNLYHSFKIPKKTHGYRQIDAPNDDLMDTLRELKTIFETVFLASHHTSAFAYVPKRCAVDAVKRHQSNKSRWFLKIDYANFFGSTTEEFAYNMLSKIWPFSEFIKNPEGCRLLKKALSLGFYNGILPQGTPLSPMLTNLIMIPIDHYLSNGLRSFKNKRFVYTRYADDIDISCREDFSPADVIKYIQDCLKKFDAPYVIKTEKTHYGSNSGRNWILGVMYTNEFRITIGKKRKNALRGQLNNYSADKKHNKNWDLSDVQHLNGILSYYKKIEKDYIENMLKVVGEKHSVNIMAEIRNDLKTL